MGGVHNFTDELESYDFIHDFEGRRECSKHSLELNFCSVINRAESMTISGSEMVTNCGGNVGAGAGTVGERGLTETAVGGDDSDNEDPIDLDDIVVPTSSPSPLGVAVISLALGGIAYMFARTMRKPKTEKTAPRE